MRKIKSTALLGAFVAVASLGVISHEAHGTTIGTPNNEPNIISKEMLPNSAASLKVSIIPSVGFSGSSITLTISGASFIYDGSYTISGASCTASATASTAQNSLTFTSCSVSQSSAYAIVGPLSSSYLSVSVPASSSSIVLAYNSNAVGDTSATTTIATVQQQLSFAPISAGTAYINPSSLSTFLSGSYAPNTSPYNIGSNSVVLSNSAYGNKTWSTTIPSSDIMSFLFTGIPSSVSSVTGSDLSSAAASVYPGNQSATISFNPYYAFNSSSLDTITFYFSNSSGVSISTGTISLSSILGTYTIPGELSSTSYVYSSTPQNFLTFAIGGTQLYIPDALAPDNNAIQHGYITISMPSSTDIASISVLNVPSASCPAPSLSNGLLTSTSTPGVYYIDLSQLAQACTGLSASAWQSGVPLVIYINNAVPTQVTADAYAVFNGMLKRIPVDVLNTSYSNASFNY